MSGVKESRTTITTRELRRLRDMAARAASLARDNQALQALNSSISNSLANANNNINNLNGRLNRMNNQMQANAAAAGAAARELRDNLNEAVRDSNRRLAQQAEAHQRQITAMKEDFNAAIKENRRDIEQIINNNNAVIHTEINNLRNDVNGQIAQTNARLESIENSVAGMAADNATLLEMAREFLSVADSINADSETYRCETLLPGRFAQVRAQMQRAQQDIALAEKNPANSSVARFSARDAYESALRFHEDIILAEQEWLLRYQQARQTVDSVAQRIESNPSVETEGCEVDVEYWSGGAYKPLKNRIHSVSEYLESDDVRENPVDNLENVITIAQQIDNDTMDVIAFSIAAFENSQNYCDNSEDLGYLLKERFGLITQSEGYQGNDNRAAHMLHLKNPITGFEMVITQKPETDEEGSLSTCFSTDIIDYGSNNEGEARAIACSVFEVVSLLGFPVGEVCTGEGYETKPSDRVTHRDISTWTTQTAVTAAKPVTRSGVTASKPAKGEATA